MKYDFELYKLSNQFFVDYPPNIYPEILSKPNRPHYCLLIDIHCDYFICIPFRSNIEHKNAFKFTNTQRSQKFNSGLDYSKMVIINNNLYLDNANIIVDQDEFNQAIQNIHIIVNDACKYLKTYMQHIKGEKVLHEKQYNRMYKYYTLPYFHNILKLQIITPKQLITV